jgi:hypothetical protein
VCACVCVCVYLLLDSLECGLQGFGGCHQAFDCLQVPPPHKLDQQGHLPTIVHLEPSSLPQYGSP